MSDVRISIADEPNAPRLVYSMAVEICAECFSLVPPEAGLGDRHPCGR